LIEQGYLAPIRVETLPLKIDLSGVGLDSRGDLDVTQAGGVVAPYLDALAAELVRRRARKLPLVELSKRFAVAARSRGLAAEHIDGNSQDIGGKFLSGLRRIKPGAFVGHALGRGL
jgi:hypothetical protein